jgi:hypothetical protein
MVVHVCNSSYMGGGDRRITVQGKSMRHYLKIKLKQKGLGEWLKW